MTAKLFDAVVSEQQLLDMLAEHLPDVERIIRDGPDGTASDSTLCKACACVAFAEIVRSRGTESDG